MSVRGFEMFLLLLRRFYGAKSLKVAMSYHLVARADSCKGDFRTALNHEKEAFTIYRQMVTNPNAHRYLFCRKCMPAKKVTPA